MKIPFRRHEDPVVLDWPLFEVVKQWKPGEHGLTPDQLTAGVLKRASVLIAQNVRYRGWGNMVHVNNIGFVLPKTPGKPHDVPDAQRELLRLGKQVDPISERRAASFYYGGMAGYVALSDEVGAFMPHLTERVGFLASLNAPAKVNSYLHTVARGGFPSQEVQAAMHNLFMGGEKSLAREGYPREYFMFGAQAILAMSYDMIFPDGQSDGNAAIAAIPPLPAQIMSAEYQSH